MYFAVIFKCCPPGETGAWVVAGDPPAGPRSPQGRDTGHATGLRWGEAHWLRHRGGGGQSGSQLQLFHHTYELRTRPAMYKKTQS